MNGWGIIRWKLDVTTILTILWIHYLWLRFCSMSPGRRRRRRLTLIFTNRFTLSIFSLFVHLWSAKVVFIFTPFSLFYPFFSSLLFFLSLNIFAHSFALFLSLPHHFFRLFLFFIFAIFSIYQSIHKSFPILTIR